MNSLIMSLSKFVNKSLNEMSLYPNLEFIQVQKKNCVQEFFLKHEKGCSHAYKLLLKAHLRDENIKPPPALATASISYIFLFDQDKWQKSLRYVSKRIALPHSSTTILKIFYRQNWNPWKQGMHSGDNNESFCKYCADNVIANSRHIFLDCPIAIQAWTFFNSMTQELFNSEPKPKHNLLTWNKC